MHLRSFSPLLCALLLLPAAALTGCNRQTAEEKGAAMATDKIDLVKGVGGALEQKGEQAAESLTSGLGKVVQGVGKGIEKSGRALVVEPGLAQAGLQVTKVQELTAGQAAESHGLEAYVIADKACDGVLAVKVYDAVGREIGRARVPLQRGADSAAYVAIPLEAQVSVPAIAKVVVDFQPKSAG